MQLAIGHTYTTTDLRKPEVVEEAFDHPVAVRDGRSGRLLLVTTIENAYASNDLLRYARMLLVAMIETKRDDPSPAALGDLYFIADWSDERRDRFLGGMAEALTASISEGHPKAVEAYVRYMTYADDPVPPRFRPDFLDQFGEALQARVASCSQQAEPPEPEPIEDDAAEHKGDDG